MSDFNLNNNITLSNESVAELCRDFILSNLNRYSFLRDIYLEDYIVYPHGEGENFFKSIVFKNFDNTKKLIFHLNLYTTQMVCQDKSYNITNAVRERFLEMMRLENGVIFEKLYAKNIINSIYKNSNNFSLEENIERLNYMLSLINKKARNPESLIYVGIDDKEFNFEAELENLPPKARERYNQSEISDLGLSFLKLNRISKHYVPLFSEYNLSGEELIKICEISAEADESENEFKSLMQGAKFIDCGKISQIKSVIKVVPQNGINPFFIYFSYFDAFVDIEGNYVRNCIALNKNLVNHMLSKYAKRRYKEKYIKQLLTKLSNYDQLYYKACIVLKALGYIGLEPMDLTDFLTKDIRDISILKDLKPLDSKNSENLVNYFKEIDNALHFASIINQSKDPIQKSNKESSSNIEQKENTSNPEQKENFSNSEQTEQLDFEMFDQIAKTDIYNDNLFKFVFPEEEELSFSNSDEEKNLQAENKMVEAEMVKEVDEIKKPKAVYNSARKFKQTQEIKANIDANELCEKREISVRAVNNFLFNLNSSVKDGILYLNKLPFQVCNAKVSQPTKSKIIINFVEDIFGQKFSRELTATPYNITAEEFNYYSSEAILINKLYFQALQSFGEIDIEDEDYIKDYINYTISIHPNNSKINLFVTLLEKLLFLQRFPKDIKEFIASDFNTDNINSKLEKVNLNQVSKLKKVFIKISEYLKNKNAFKRTNYISYDEELEYLCNNFEEIIKPYRVETQSTEKNQLGE